MLQKLNKSLQEFPVQPTNATRTCMKPCRFYFIQHSLAHPPASFKMSTPVSEVNSQVPYKHTHTHTYLISNLKPTHITVSFPETFHTALPPPPLPPTTYLYVDFLGVLQDVDNISHGSDTYL